jgi:hypothetical protein
MCVNLCVLESFPLVLMGLMLFLGRTFPPWDYFKILSFFSNYFDFFFLLNIWSLWNLFWCHVLSINPTLFFFLPGNLVTRCHWLNSLPYLFLYVCLDFLKLKKLYMLYMNPVVLLKKKSWLTLRSRTAFCFSSHFCHPFSEMIIVNKPLYTAFGLFSTAYM